MNRVRTHKFASGVYRVDEEEYDGITIPNGCQRALHAWLHEAFHAEFPEMAESQIEAADKHIGGFL